MRAKSCPITKKMMREGIRSVRSGRERFFIDPGETASDWITVSTLEYRKGKAVDQGPVADFKWDARRGKIVRWESYFGEKNLPYAQIGGRLPPGFRKRVEERMRAATCRRRNW